LNPETIGQWIIKAENDYRIGIHEMDEENPATDMICFHMQQCAEKYLKAYLAYKDSEIRKTHDIAVLFKGMLSYRR